MALRVVAATLFSPRGGSAQVMRALVEGLRAQGCSVTLVAGSRSDLGADGDAGSFYGEDVHAVSFDVALASATPLRFEGPPGSAPARPTPTCSTCTISPHSTRPRPASPRTYPSWDISMAPSF